MGSDCISSSSLLIFLLLIYLLDNIYIGFGTKLYRQIVGIPMGTNCAPLVADLFVFCYERDSMTSLSDVKQAEIIEAFKSTSRYLDDLLNIDNPYFEGMVNRIYPPELELNKANTSNTEAPFLDLHLSISNGFVSSKIPRAGPGVERIGRMPPPLAQSVETWPIGVRLVCRELRPVSLEERILVIERVGCGRHATHYFGLNFS